MNKDDAIEAAAQAEFEYLKVHRGTAPRGQWDELTPTQRSNYRVPARRIIEAYLKARAAVPAVPATPQEEKP